MYTKKNNAPEIISDYSDLFESSLAKLPTVYHMELDEAVTPVIICSARRNSCGNERWRDK